MKTKPLISWPGGKTRLLNLIVPHIPAAAGYIEVFAGGCAVLLAKPASKMEVVNDIHGDIVTLYRVAKHHPDALAAEMLLMPSSRQYLTECVALLKTSSLTDIQRAALFLHANKISFSANGESFAVAKNPGSCAFISKDSLLSRISDFARRMGRVAIENMDYRRLLKTYDHPGNLFFLDPPYLNASIKNYRGWTELEMGQLHTAVLGLTGQWIVTVDDSPINRILWLGHDCHFLTTRNGCLNNALDSSSRFGEMIVYSPGLRNASSAAIAA